LVGVHGGYAFFLTYGNTVAVICRTRARKSGT
jgi:hypothetical protein